MLVFHGPRALFKGSPAYGNESGFISQLPGAISGWRCKRRPLRLWEFNPEGPRVLQHFLGMTPVEMYKLFFGPQVVYPDSTEDAGLRCNRPDTQVSSLVPGLAIRIFIIKLPLKELSFKQEWIAKAKLIRCPAPLPETTPGPVLVRMLEVVSSKESEEGTRKLQPPRRRLSGREESKIPLLRGRRGPPLKTRRPWPQSGGRNLRQRVLCWGILRPNYALKGISPPPSRK